MASFLVTPFVQQVLMAYYFLMFGGMPGGMGSAGGGPDKGAEIRENITPSYTEVTHTRTRVGTHLTPDLELFDLSGLRTIFKCVPTRVFSVSFSKTEFISVGLLSS
jgi:hypothetical protein